MTSKNERPKRFVQTTGDAIINKHFHIFNITIDQCKFVPKCWFNDLTNATFYKSPYIVIATYGSLTHSTNITYVLVLMQLHLNPSFKGNQ
jgi:hypothetical protein